MRVDIPRRITKVDYKVDANKTTHCFVTLDNGNIYHGTKVCIDPSKYVQNLYEAQSYEDAIDRIEWLGLDVKL